MKKVFSILILGLPLVLAPVFSGCVEEVQLVEELNLPACLTPSSATASIDRTDGHTVTFTWANSKGATQYVLEIYEGGETDLAEDVFGNGTPVRTETVPAGESGSTTSMKVSLEVDKYYFARVKAQSMQADGQTRAIDDSRWQIFGYPIATYPVKDPVEKVEVKERKTTSVVISWTMPENDTEVDRIRVTPNPDPSDERAYKDYLLPEDVTVTGGAVVEFEVGAGTDAVPLEASTFYTFAVHYGNATRGEVTAWTRPDWSEAQDAPDVATLERLLGEAGDPSQNTAQEGESVEPRQIRLTNTETDYEVEKLAVYGPVIIFGETSADGKNPKVVGTISLNPAGTAYSYTVLSDAPESVESTVSVASSIGATYLRLEALDLEGTSSNADCVSINEINDQSGDKISVDVINCNLYAYNKSAFYNNKVATFGDILFDGCYFEEVNKNQQSAFDIRKALSIDSFTVRNCTFTNSVPAMAFMRIDEFPVGEIQFDHNTLYNVGGSFAESLSIFRVKADFTYFELTDNIFADIEQAFVYGGTKVPSTISSNFFYKIAETAWAPEEDGSTTINEKGEGELAQSAAIAKGGAMINSDPFENAERGLFNIDNALIEEAGAGDPRWLVPYVPEEVPPLSAVDYGYTWDLTDVETFYDEIEDSTVRGNIEFFIVDNPIRVSDAGMEFSAEAVLSTDGTPSDCGIAFLVDGPGSVVLSTEQSRSGSVNDHISVAYRTVGSTGSTTVEGAVPVDANGARVPLADIRENTRTMVYLYACGPITLTGLSWIEDVTTLGPSVLDTPEGLALTAASGDDTAAEVTLSWNEVPSAGSYNVIITGPGAMNAIPDPVNVTSNSYTFKPSSFSTGVYTFAVQAVKAEGDLNHEDSEISETTVTFEKTEAWTAVSSTSPTTWGSDVFKYMYEITGGDSDRDYVYENMKFLAGGSEISFVSEKNTAGADAYAFNSGGSGSTSKRALQFIVPGPGTLTYEAISAGSDPRPVIIFIGDQEYTSGAGYETNVGKEGKNGYPAPAKGSTDAALTTRTFDLSAESVPSGTVISLSSDNSGINFFSVTWTPAGYDPDASIPSDPAAVEVKTDFMSYFADKAGYDIAAAGSSSVVKFNNDDEVTFVAKGGSDPKAIVWDAESTRIKLQGESLTDEATGIPTANYIAFKITKPGTIKHYIRSGSSGDGKREVKIDILKNGSEIVNIYTGYAPTPGYKEGSETSAEITKEHLSGAKSAVTVYIYAPTNSVNIYYLEYIPAE